MWGPPFFPLPPSMTEYVLTGTRRPPVYTWECFLQGPRALGWLRFGLCVAFGVGRSVFAVVSRSVLVLVVPRLRWFRFPFLRVGFGCSAFAVVSFNH